MGQSSRLCAGDPDVPISMLNQRAVAVDRQVIDRTTAQAGSTREGDFEVGPGRRRRKARG